MATVKQIIQQFCYRANLPASSAYVTVTTPAEAQYTSLFKMVGDMLRNGPYVWPQLKRNYTITVTNSVNKIQLPGDFYRLLDTTQWDLTNQWALEGPMSDAAMTNRQYAVVALQTRKAFRILGPTQYIHSTSPYTQRSAGYLHIDPTPDNSTDQLYMEYLGANWIWPIDWVTNTAYTAGAVRTGVGNMYVAGNSATSSTTRPSHTTGTVYDGGGTTGVSWTPYYEPYDWFVSGTDNDLCLFDEDLMIEGMIWAYRRAKDLPFEAQKEAWEEMARQAAARFHGTVRVSAAGPCEDEDEGWPNTPSGSWSV